MLTGGNLIEHDSYAAKIVEKEVDKKVRSFKIRYHNERDTA